MPRAVSAMNVVAALILVVAAVWGAILYPALPDTLTTHWNAAGVADGFRPTGFWSAFGMLVIAAVSLILLLALQMYFVRQPWLMPTEKCAYGLALAYVNLSMVAIFVWVAGMTWSGQSPGPLFLVAAIMAGLPVLIIIGYHLPQITEERKAIQHPQEPSMNPRYWVLGGMFYSNPDDPRTMVPRPPHMGFGGTFNLATPGGKVLVILIVLLLLGSVSLPFWL